jgi:hypothetical protein
VRAGERQPYMGLERERERKERDINLFKKQTKKKTRKTRKCAYYLADVSPFINYFIR